MAGRSFFPLDRTKVRAFVRLVPGCRNCSHRQCDGCCEMEFGALFTNEKCRCECFNIGNTACGGCNPDNVAFQQVGRLTNFVSQISGHISARCVEQPVRQSAIQATGLDDIMGVLRHRRTRQHGQRKHQSFHLQSPVLRNSRHHRARLRGCQHPRPAGKGVFRRPERTVPGKARLPALCAFPTSLLGCGRRHTDVARIFPAVRGGAS